MKRTLLIGLLGGGFLAAQAMAADEPTGERLFRHLDSDNNGAVSEQEYVMAAENRARRIFKRIDKDGNGQISPQEYQAAGKKLKQFIDDRREQREATDNSN